MPPFSLNKNHEKREEEKRRKKKYWRFGDGLWVTNAPLSRGNFLIILFSGGQEKSSRSAERFWIIKQRMEQLARFLSGAPRLRGGNHKLLYLKAKFTPAVQAKQFSGDQELWGSQDKR